jgi:hypothetical protein
MQSAFAVSKNGTEGRRGRDGDACGCALGFAATAEPNCFPGADAGDEELPSPDGSATISAGNA